MIELIFLKVLILISVKKHLEIYVNRTTCLCKFYYFLDKNFKCCPYLCDGCYSISMKTVSTQNLTIINHNGNYYRVIFAFMTKNDAYNLIKNAITIGKKGTL